MMTKKYITQLSYDIIGCAIKVHKALGPALLESVYQKCLKHELLKSNFEVKTQVAVPIKYDTILLETELRLDFLVNDAIIVEIKATEHIIPLYEAQLLSYMKLLEKPQGLLINFHSTNIQSSAKPFVNNYFSELPD